MMFYALLAYAHHLAAFALISLLAIEWMLVRPNLKNIDISTLSKVDLWYGLVALALLIVGVARLLWGEKGWEPYLYNPVFIFKIGAFVLAGILSIWPTLTYPKWRRAQSTAANYQPEAQDVLRVRRFIQVQFLFLLGIPLLAAMMARGIGL
jgi:putative membrane protein